MPVVTNLSPTPIFLLLNSGESIRLSPGTASGPVADVELKDNQKINKLLRQRVISVETESKGGSKIPKGDADPSSVDAPSESRTRTSSTNKKG